MKSFDSESTDRIIKLLTLLSLILFVFLPKALAQGQGTLVKDTYTATQGQASNSKWKRGVDNSLVIEPQSLCRFSTDWQ